MEKYKNAHKWLLIPLAITLIGFFPSYFSKFTSAEFGHHVHGLSATAWYIFVIYQPFLVAKGQIAKHKKYGLIGIFLAGLVVASGLTMIPGNIEGAMAQEARGTASAVAPPFFLYGVSLFDLVAILGFGFSVVMGALKARQIDEHAIWMISTVFWALMPALARFALIPAIMMDSITHFANLGMITSILIIGSIVILMWRLKRIHVALVAAAICNLLSFLIVPLGKSEVWIAFTQGFFKF